MKAQFTILILIAWLAIGLQIAGAEPVASKPPAVEIDSRLHSDGKGWRLQRAANIDSKLPRVLLIGDSILSGYLPIVTKALDRKANLDAWINPYWQGENTNKVLAEVLANGPYDLVFFNLGLHGLAKGRIPEGKFEPLTKAYVEVLQHKCPKAKLIWATITPVTVKGNPTELDPVINATILEHNRMATRVMNEAHTPSVDFYALLAGKLNLARGDGFHWTQPAYQVSGDAAATAILQALSPKP